MKCRAVLGEVGDTIVEVMVVLTILSLAFGIAYATANSGLTRSRAAEEHSEALGMLEGQVELVRADFADNQDLTIYNEDASGNHYSFCFKTPVTTSPPTIVPFTHYQVPQSGASDPLTSYPSACTSGYYNLSITYRTPPAGQTWESYFDFLVRWQGPGNLGLQQEELTYKISYLSTALGQPNFEDLILSSARVGFVSSKVIPQQFSYSANLKAAG